MLDVFFVFKQKTAYEMRISDWSSDVCSSDLGMVIAISHARRSVGTSKLASYCILSKCPLRPFARESGGDSLIPSSRILHQPSHERNLGSRVAFDPARKQIGSAHD